MKAELDGAQRPVLVVYGRNRVLFRPSDPIARSPTPSRVRPCILKRSEKFFISGYNSTCSSRTFSSRIGIPVLGVRGQGIPCLLEVVGEASLIETPVLSENTWVRSAERVHQPVGDRLLVRQEALDQGHVERRSRRFDRS